MMRSLFAGVSGLRNHQTRMDVIGNNIANVNTVGFKAGRVTFQDVLSQTLQGASSGGAGRGGTNPMQVGLGMGLASIDTIFTDGSFQPTGKQTDLSIQGQGFFILTDGSNRVYTRAGSFDFDNEGNFLVPGTGYKVMGWMANNGTINALGDPTAIQIPVGKSMDARPTKEITFSKNLSADAVAGDTVRTSINVFDSLGRAQKIDCVFTKTPNDREWEFSVTSPASAVIAPTTFTFDASGKIGTPLGSSITYTPPGLPDMTIDIVFNDLTHYGGESTAQAVLQNGYTAGTLDTVSIDPNGIIVGRFTNGQSQELAQLALATFNNPAGLNKIGESLFVESTNSGVAQAGTAGTGGRGKFNPGSLEMANVDLAQEFSNMIITQRGFQANSKIITVTDEMLQDLANLKR